MNHLHTTQHMDNHILSQLQQTIDNLNHIVNNLRQDLDDVLRDLQHSNQQNQHLQQKLINLARPTPNLSQHSVQPIPTIIHTDASIASQNSPIPPTPLIPPSLPASQHASDPMIAAFMNAQQTFMSNQDRLIAHIFKTNTSPKKKTTRDEFNDWYSKVISLLATEDWLPLYDRSNMDVVEDDNTNAVLNNHRYSVLLNKSKDKPLKFIQSRQHLWSNGVALLRELRQTYHGQLTKLEIKEQQSTLLSSNWSRGPNENVDTFASRTMQIRRDLKDHSVLISPETLKECFIMGLGPDFTDIQKDLQWDRLHPEWTPLDIVELIEPARKVLQITSDLRINNQTYKLVHSTNRKSTNSILK